MKAGLLLIEYRSFFIISLFIVNFLRENFYLYLTGMTCDGEHPIALWLARWLLTFKTCINP